MDKRIGFYNLDELVTDQSMLSDIPRNDKWLAIPYETAERSGTMLCCGECARPSLIELKLELTGWYRIYIGMINSSYKCQVGITVGNRGKSIVKAMPSRAWGATEYGHRFFYRAADMTGQNITISKPGPYDGFSASVSFLEFEKMTEEEIAEYTRKDGGAMYFHFDEGFLGECTYEKDEDYLGYLNMLEGCRGGLFCMETVSSQKAFGTGDNGDTFTDFAEKANRNMERYHERRAVLKPMIIKRAHELGFEVYSANRIQVGDFQLPLAREMVETFALQGNEKMTIKTRDGRTAPALSYAYERVREMSVESIIHATEDYAYDGVCLAFHRGVFVGFEQPVLHEVMKRYGVDARLLPASDERLNGVWREYVTDFLRLLRRSLDERYGEGKKKISAIVYADINSCTNFGFDVETWLCEGLVDNVAQGLMTWWEQLDGCLDKNGLVDMEKYKTEITKRAVLMREYKFKDPERLLTGTVEFQKLCDKYGVEFYATLGWDEGDPVATIELSRRFREKGIRKIFSWNANRKIPTPALLNTEKYIAANFNDGLTGYPEPIERFRALKYGDNDISYFDVNWNG